MVCVKLVLNFGGHLAPIWHPLGSLWHQMPLYVRHYLDYCLGSLAQAYEQRCLDYLLFPHFPFFSRYVVECVAVSLVSIYLNGASLDRTQRKRGY